MIRDLGVDRLLSLGRELNKVGGVQLHIRNNWKHGGKKKLPGQCGTCPIRISGPCLKLPQSKTILSGIIFMVC